MDEFELANLPPEVIAQLVEMGTISEEQAELAKQLQTAETLRYKAGPRGRHTRATYVAANPLEHLGDFLQKRKAKKDIGRIEGEQDVLRTKKSEGRTAFLDLLAGKDRGQLQPEGATTYAMPGQDAPMAGQNIASGLPQAQPPVSQISPNISPADLDIPFDQFAIGAGGDTSRDIGGRRGVVSVGDIPPPQAGVGPGGEMLGDQPPLSLDAQINAELPPIGAAGQPPAPQNKTAYQLYLEAIRGTIPQGGQGVY